MRILLTPACCAAGAAVVVYCWPTSIVLLVVLPLLALELLDPYWLYHSLLLLCQETYRSLEIV